MGVFGFEDSFLKAISEVKKYGARKHYINEYSGEVECILDTYNDVVYDTHNNIMEDQNRYKYLIKMGALTETKSYDVNEGLSIHDFERGSYLHEAKESYEIYIGSPSGSFKVTVTKLGEFVSVIHPDNPKKSMDIKEVKNDWFGKGVKDFSEVKKFNGSNAEEIIKLIDKRVSLDFNVKSVSEI